MKALVLSDLHWNYHDIHDSYSILKLKRIFHNFIKEDYDIVLISGDIFESSIMKYNNPFVNPYIILEEIFENKKVIFCLGNHEFAFQDYYAVLDYYGKKQLNNGIYCLDICDKIMIDNINFVGNVFWYDWSLNHNRLLMKGEILNGWLDHTIINFDPIKYNEINKNSILQSLSKENKNVLITHTVPHKDLNTFSIEEPYSAYNAYSGCDDFLKEIKDYPVEYAICGHTHRREIKEIYGIKCINIGNDYFFHTNKIEYKVIEL